MPDNQIAEGSRYLIEFIDQFTGLLEFQLIQVRNSLESTVEEIMNSVNNISETVDNGRIQADKSLESTYLRPDPETQVLVEGLQTMIDDVFDRATAELRTGGDVSQISVSATPDTLLTTRIQRFKRRFAPELSILAETDSKLSKLIMGIVGSLSAEDVIAQRIDHSILGLKVLQTGLSYVLIDYEGRCTIDLLENIRSDMCHYMFKQYHSEEEKEEYFQFFPKPD